METIKEKKVVLIATISIVVFLLVSVPILVNYFNIGNTTSNNEDNEDNDDNSDGDFIYNYIYYDNSTENTFNESNQIPLYTDRLAEISQWDDNYGIAKNLVVIDDLAYLANGRSFLIINVSIPSRPVVLSDYFQESVDVKVVNDLAYIAGGGLVILNISDPFNPVKLSDYKVNHPINAVDVQGNLAYIIDPYGGDLYIINISSPINPFLVGSCEYGGGWRLVVKNNYAYVVDRNLGAKIIKIADPGNPTILLEDTGSGRATGIHIVDNILYIADGYDYLFLYNISNPESPQFMSSIDIFDAHDVYVQDEVAYVASGNSGLVVIDVHNPHSIFKIGQCAAEDGEAYGIYVVNDIAYMADYGNGLEIIDISDPYDPIEVGHVSEGGYSRDLILNGDLIYIADDNGGLEIINVSNPFMPYKISDFHVHSYCLAVNANQAHVVHYSEGYKIIDISDPHDPILLNTYELTQYNYEPDIALKGNFTYIANARGGVVVLDVSNPLNINKVTQLYTTDTRTTEVHISGNYIIIVETGYSLYYRISIYNNTDPFNLSYIGTYVSKNAYPYSIDIMDDIAFMKEAAYTDFPNYITGISIINFSDPLHPFKIGELRGLDNPQAFEFEDGLLFVADKGLRVFNISNIDNITLLGQFYDGGLGTLHGISYSDGIIYLADGIDNLEIVGFDNDNDTLANYVEINIYNTDPEDLDTDDDGISDGEEILNDTDPNDPYDY